VVAEHDEDSEARHIAGNRPVIYFDDRFRGFTVLSSYDESAEHSTANQDPLDRPSTVEGYPMDLVAISGLGGHAFGSFKERGGSHMWLADAQWNKWVATPTVGMLVNVAEAGNMMRSASIGNMNDHCGNLPDEIYWNSRIVIWPDA
jgi:hypothetical protein